MKIALKMILFVFFVEVVFCTVSSASSDLSANILTAKVFINNIEEKFKKPLVLINGTTYVPLREMNEKLNMYVNWDSKNETILINGNTAGRELYPFETEDGLWGYMDKDDNVIIKPIYYYAENFVEELALVRKSLGGNYGFIDKYGNEVIECKYYDAYSFSCGAALVYLADYTDADMWSYVDKNGDLLFDKTFALARNFKEDYAAVVKRGSVFPINNASWSYIDKNGNFATALEFEDVRDFCDGYALVKNDGKWGIIDNTFNVIVPYQFEDAKLYEEGEVYIKMGNYWEKTSVIKLQN